MNLDTIKCVGCLINQVGERQCTRCGAGHGCGFANIWSRDLKRRSGVRAKDAARSAHLHLELVEWGW